MVANATLLWRLAIGCHHWGPGCWLPGFAGTDSSPSLSRDEHTIVIGSYSGDTFGISSNGSKVWQVPSWSGSTLYDSVGEGTPALVTRPGADDCFVVAGISTVKCLKVSGGAAAWSWSPAEGGQISSCGAVDAARQLVFVGTLKKQFFAVNTSDGRTVWRYDTDGEIWATHGPRLAGADLVCTGVGGEANPSGDCHAEVHCIDRSTGTRRWMQTMGRQVQSTPAVGAETLYVGDYDNCLYAFGLTSGERKWRTCTEGRLESSPTVFNDPANGTELVIVGSGDGKVYAFTREGAVKWSARLGPPVGLFGGGVGSTARLVGRVVYVGGPDALWALDVESGRALWKFGTGKMVGSSPVVNTHLSRLYVGCEDGYLYGFALPPALRAPYVHPR